MQQPMCCESRSSAGLHQLFRWIGLCLGVCAGTTPEQNHPLWGGTHFRTGGCVQEERARAAPKLGCPAIYFWANSFWLYGLRGIVEVTSSEPAQLRAGGLRCRLRPRGFAGFAGLSVLQQQPIVEAIDDGHEGGLVQIAADARSDPRFVTVGGEADSDANVGG